ncbi:MAG TPA: Crp/Fnr family transcriptional regulator [Candidatus Acidoferrales bacterium]|nr:Crp/Fnr family transcriptional regulator [Candidatus Acidoferrales bacterium]
MSQAETALASLRRVPLFAGLSDAELDFLVRRALRRDYSAGEMVFAEGEPCEGLFVIESARVKIFKTSADGREQVLHVGGPGSSMAELPVFDGGPYPASAAVLSAGSLLEVRKKDVHQLCLDHPEVALKLLRVVGTRLRHLVDIIEELSFTTVRQRLAALLVRQARAQGRPNGTGIEFELPGTHQELAAHIGTVRELVSRNLGRLQSAGILQVEGRKILVCDVQALEAEAQTPSASG